MVKKGIRRHHARQKGRIQRTGKGAEHGNEEQCCTDLLDGFHGAKFSIAGFEVLLRPLQALNLYRQQQHTTQKHQYGNDKVGRNADYPVNVHKFLAGILLQKGDRRQVHGAAQRSTCAAQTDAPAQSPTELALLRHSQKCYHSPPLSA